MYSLAVPYVQIELLVHINPKVHFPLRVYCLGNKNCFVTYFAFGLRCCPSFGQLQDEYTLLLARDQDYEPNRYLGKFL